MNIYKCLAIVNNKSTMKMCLIYEQCFQALEVKEQEKCTTKSLLYISSSFSPTLERMRTFV